MHVCGWYWWTRMIVTAKKAAKFINALLSAVLGAVIIVCCKRECLKAALNLCRSVIVILQAMMGSPDVNESQEQSCRGAMGQGDPRTPSQRCSQRISQIIEGTFPALQTINDAKLVVSELNLDLNKTNERLQHMIKDVDKRRKASSAVFCQQKKSLESWINMFDDIFAAHKWNSIRIWPCACQ